MKALFRKENLELAQVDLPAVVRDVASLLHSDAILHDVRFRFDVSSRLSPVRGDRVHLQQVVLNLLLNAFDAMRDVPANEREIQLWVAPQGDDSLRVGVSDCGTGIPAETLERVFEPFYTTKGEGLGMGLAISRSIIEVHGGRLWAESNDPKPGMTFYFSVPLWREAARRGSMEYQSK
jgi:two-component system sensor kinase FixL